jgi:MFS transporter, Spinster family, sphingosine-1-phosphate transporter
MSDAGRPARYAWIVVAVLLPVALLNYLDRQMLATMKASMVADIPSIANRADWGLVLGSFKWTYALLGPIGGYVADRFGRRWTIGASLFAWSAVTWWTGHATSFHELLAARAMMGVSEAFYFPAALALITEHHLGPTRSRAVGLHQTGVYLGQILGGFAGYVAESPSHGWRWAFSASGLLGVVYAIPLLAILRDRERPSGDVAAPPPTTGGRADCLATATTCCSWRTSPSRQSPGGSCATGCRRSCASGLAWGRGARG